MRANQMFDASFDQTMSHTEYTHTIASSGLGLGLVLLLSMFVHFKSSSPSVSFLFFIWPHSFIYGCAVYCADFIKRKTENYTQMLVHVLALKLGSIIVMMKGERRECAKMKWNGKTPRMIDKLKCKIQDVSGMSTV